MRYMHTPSALCTQGTLVLALLGVLWRPASANLVLDAGIRRGLQGGPDWQVTAGVTVGFSLTSRERTASR